MKTIKAWAVFDIDTLQGGSICVESPKRAWDLFLSIYFCMSKNIDGKEVVSEKIKQLKTAGFSVKEITITWEE